MIGINVSSRIGNIRRFGQNLAREVEKAVDDGGRAVRDYARSIAPVDTGEYRASIHFVSARASGFSQASKAAARHAAFGGRSYAQHGMPGRKRAIGHSLGGNAMYAGGSAPRPTNPYESYVFAAAFHSRFVEYGNRYFRGYYVLTRAAQFGRPLQRQLILGAIKRAKTGGI
jgi:hypothetical protein